MLNHQLELFSELNLNMSIFIHHKIFYKILKKYKLKISTTIHTFHLQFHLLIFTYYLKKLFNIQKKINNIMIQC